MNGYRERYSGKMVDIRYWEGMVEKEDGRVTMGSVVGK